MPHADAQAAVAERFWVSRLLHILCCLATCLSWAAFPVLFCLMQGGPGLRCLCCRVLFIRNYHIEALLAYPLASLLPWLQDPIWMLEARCVYLLQLHGCQSPSALLQMLGGDPLLSCLGTLPGELPVSALVRFLSARVHLFRREQTSYQLAPGQRRLLRRFWLPMLARWSRSASEPL